MFIQVIALGGILYAGYRQFKKQQIEAEKQKTIEFEKNLYDKKIDQIFDDVNEGKNTKANEQADEETFEAINDREIKSAAIALGFATGGLLFNPLGYASVPFILYSSKLVLKAAFDKLKQGKIDIETLVSSLVLGTVGLKRFFIASFAILIFKLSMKLTSRVIQDSRNQLVDIFSQTPETVWLLVNGTEVCVPFQEVKEGDIVVVQAGDTIPVDGKVHQGMASVDQHILTGEAVPVEKGEGEAVFAMTLVLSGRLLIEVEKTGEESTAAKITKILNNTSDYTSGVQLRAELVSRSLINPALIASVGALPIVGPAGALGVMGCHPANSLISLAPITILKHLNVASKHGILIKDGRSLELLREVDTIVFDKTGTLTEEQPHVGSIHCFAKFSEEEVLRLACAAEHKQTHPLAKAISEEAQKRNIRTPIPEYCEYKLGYGLVVTVQEQVVHVGSSRFMDAEGITLPTKLKNLKKKSHQEGYSLVMVAADKKLIGAIELWPTVRPEAKTVIQQLKNRESIKYIYIISGDGEVPTRELAKKLGIDHYFAETLPENKAALIQKLQREGRKICFIGDGINDSIALKTAQVSVSLAGASKIATDTAQVILMDSGIEHLNFLFDLANSLNKTIDNLFVLMLAPSLMGVGGIFLLGAGISSVLSLGLAGTAASIGYVMLPVSKKLQLPDKEGSELEAQKHSPHPEVVAPESMHPHLPN